MSFFGLPTESELVSRHKNRFLAEMQFAGQFIVQCLLVAVMYRVCIVYTRCITFVACVCV